MASKSKTPSTHTLKAHAVAEMISEGDDAEDQPEEVEEWAKVLSKLMIDSVIGQAQSRKGIKGEKDAATMTKLLDEGKR
jgi:hypothetical protein